MLSMLAILPVLPGFYTHIKPKNSPYPIPQPVWNLSPSIMVQESHTWRMYQSCFQLRQLDKINVLL